MSQETKTEGGVRTAPMTKAPVNTSRASLAELIKRTNQTVVRITAKD
jgi:hypothetical protein